MNKSAHPISTKELFVCNIDFLKPLFNNSTYPWDILPKIGEFASKLIKKGIKGYTRLGKNILIGKNVKIYKYTTIIGPTIIGDNTEIRPGAFIRGNAIVGRNCVIGNSTELKNAILLDHVQVPHYNYVGDSILGNYAHMGAGSICSNLRNDGQNIIIHADKDYQTGLRKIGAFLGEHVQIGCGSVLNPGTVVSSDVQMWPLTMSRGCINNDSKSKTNKKKEKIAIYVNGNNKRGLGHIYRALNIADEFTTKPDIIYCTNQTDPMVFGKTKYNLVPIDGINDLFEKCKKNNYTIFINDILSTTIDYMIALKKSLPNCKIVNFEDDGEGRKIADLVINALYAKDESPNVKTGEKYYICNKAFLNSSSIKINNSVKNILISFGGADPQNYTDRLLNIIKDDYYKKFNFYVALGKAKKNINQLLTYNKYKNIKVIYDVKNMSELMSKCDMGIISRGRTGYELALLGLPAIVMAQNSLEEKHGFICNKNGFNYLGLNPSDKIIKKNLNAYLSLPKNNRLKIQKRLLSFDLKNGRKNILDLIYNLQKK